MHETQQSLTKRTCSTRWQKASWGRGFLLPTVYPQTSTCWAHCQHFNSCSATKWMNGKNESILTKEHLDSIEKYWEENKINVLFSINGQCTGNALMSKLLSFSIYILSCPCSYLIQKPKLKCTDSACLLRTEYYFWITFLAQQGPGNKQFLWSLVSRQAGVLDCAGSLQRWEQWEKGVGNYCPTWSFLGWGLQKKMKPLSARIPLCLSSTQDNREVLFEI